MSSFLEGSSGIADLSSRPSPLLLDLPAVAGGEPRGRPGRGSAAPRGLVQYQPIRPRPSSPRRSAHLDHPAGSTESTARCASAPNARWRVRCACAPVRRAGRRSRGPGSRTAHRVRRRRALRGGRGRSRTYLRAPSQASSSSVMMAAPCPRRSSCPRPGTRCRRRRHVALGPSGARGARSLGDVRRPSRWHGSAPRPPG